MATECGRDRGSPPEGVGAHIAARRRQRGVTLVGPHRDDLRLLINGKEVQQFASQGQHKTFLVALKIAEFWYVQERREESPILLLDDVFSELDERRSRRILGSCRRAGADPLLRRPDEGVLDGYCGVERPPGASSLKTGRAGRSKTVRQAISRCRSGAWAIWTAKHLGLEKNLCGVSGDHVLERDRGGADCDGDAGAAHRERHSVCRVFDVRPGGRN